MKQGKQFGGLWKNYMGRKHLKSVFYFVKKFWEFAENRQCINGNSILPNKFKVSSRDDVFVGQFVC